MLGGSFPKGLVQAALAAVLALIVVVMTAPEAAAHPVPHHNGAGASHASLADGADPPPPRG